MSMGNVAQRSMLGQMCFKGWAVIMVPARLSVIHDKTVRKEPL